MNDPELLQSTALVLVKNWEMADPGASQKATSELLLALLTSRIEQMLQTEMERLVNAMYRLDVSEKLFLNALDLETDRERAAAIARLVLEREYQKAETRRKYARRGDNKPQQPD